jgi:hypothetical protein
MEFTVKLHQLESDLVLDVIQAFAKVTTNSEVSKKVHFEKRQVYTNQEAKSPIFQQGTLMLAISRN